MLRGPDSPELFSDETLRSFIARFETGLIPGAEWTHASHVAMAGAYLLRMPAADALELVRKGILNLNAQNKVQETILRGYHESITRVWLATCDAFLQESGL
ncbi:MAG: hypothetical protein HYZ37_01240, partial [Candidatus Solibacter usitatus]|nr:hypothetical protein [Candidatus Solibacter usitatus]